MSNIADSDLASFFISANTLLRSKQNDLEKIIKTQELLINNLKQENLFLKSKLFSLEQLLFAENPQVQASMNLSGCLPDDELDAQENSIAPSPAISTINEANMNTLSTKSTLCLPDDELGAQEHRVSPSPAISSINVTNVNTLPIKSTLCISNKIEHPKQLDECPASSDENLDKDTNVPLVLTNKVVAASVQTESPTLVEIFPKPGEHKGPPLTKGNYSTTNLPKHMVFCPFLRKKGFCLKGSNCDFSHSDLNQNTATNQPLSNENQLGNDHDQRMEVYQTIPPRYPTPFCPLPPPLAVHQPPYQRPPIFQPRPLM